MKHLLYFLLAALFLVSCSDRKRTAEKAGQIDSLKTVIAEKDAAIDDVFAAVNAIAENLNAIKLRENIISHSLQGSTELNETVTSQINRDIEAINQLLISNREAISRLNQQASQLRGANAKISSLEKLIAELNVQIESKDQEIKVLQSTVASMQNKVNVLTTELYDANLHVTELEQNRSSLEGEVKVTTDILNTGYYIIGSEKELLSKEIVYKRGFIGRTIKINENRSLESFTAVDIRDFDELLIGGRKATLVSTHPAGSYQFVANSEGTVDILKITDKARFWEYSKVLVVSYK